MFPLGGSKANYKFGFIDSGAKPLQNDTWVVSNVDAVACGIITTDANGVRDPVTISSKTLTLTSTTASAGSGLIVYTGKK